MLLRRYITTTYGKQRNHLLNSRFLFWTVRSLVRLVSIHLADFRFSSSAEVGFFPFFPEKCRHLIFFFLPSNPKGASYFFSLFFFSVSWLTSLMLLVHDGYLLLAVATSSNTPAAFRRTSLCLYIRPSFFPPPLLPRELLRLYSPYENPVPGYRPSCDGGTWWPSPAVARVASHNSSSQELFWGIGGYELVASRQNTYWQRATSQLLRQNNKRRDTKNKISSVCQLALHNSCWGRNSPTF